MSAVGEALLVGIAGGSDGHQLGVVAMTSSVVRFQVLQQCVHLLASGSAGARCSMCTRAHNNNSCSLCMYTLDAMS